MLPESGFWIAPNWPQIEKITMTSKFADITSPSDFFDTVFFLLSNLVIVSSFMSISSLVLELYQFSFIRDWPEIWKSEIPPSEFFSISKDWGELEIPNLVWMLLNEMLLKAAKFQCYSFYRFWVINPNKAGLFEGSFFWQGSI